MPSRLLCIVAEVAEPAIQDNQSRMIRRADL